LEDLGIDGRIILKLILRTKVPGCRVVSAGLGYDPMKVTSEQVNEISVPLKVVDFLPS
jgi:hypothetical protein